MNQLVDRRRFCGLCGLLTLGGLVMPGCGEDMSTPKQVQTENPNEGSAKGSMDYYRNNMKKGVSKQQ
jgi:hypothetical protein